ncbi:unnamed protein product [Strongylus vulgaris]|uniref:G-protein coupled receptors family 1 profile domain-containing protein n=1 Tax=Strongylus vulgaris TaxID=40348 RepID=A0A3P7LL84_STRVU|nr:unnamed protein product [Strongylus vulgaris]
MGMPFLRITTEPHSTDNWKIYELYPAYWDFQAFCYELLLMQFVGNEFPREAANLHRLNAITVRLGYPLMLAANYAAIWLLTLICAQRFQAICHPSNPWKLRLTCIRRSKGAVTVVVGAALGLNVIRFWEMEWHADHGGIVSSGLRYVTVGPKGAICNRNLFI